MDAPVYSRGRGSKTNGSVRGAGYSKNKQWIAGQGTIGPKSRESSIPRNDSGKWERGGGTRRGRGRGRGSVQYSTHLAVPSPPQEEFTNGGEDETQDDTQDSDDGDEQENEPEVMDTEEPPLDTPEERDKLYEELLEARETERKKAIAEGLMDDPAVPKRLEDAITIVGTCMDMCPRFERYRRERQNNLDRWEVIPGTKRVDHKRAVKAFERGAGDKVVPSDLRPPEVLKKTLDYLFHDLLPREGFSETFAFIRDRTRCVRNDFTIQHDSGLIAIECHERCARYHILACHIARDTPGFVLNIEEQQLKFALTSVKEFFEDQAGRIEPLRELEMRVYHRLVHIRDQVERHIRVPPEVLSHPVFQLTSKFRLCVQASSAPLRRESKLRIDAKGLAVFAEMIDALRELNNPAMTFLIACILELHFGKGAVEGIEALRGDLTIEQIIDGTSGPLVLRDPPTATTPSNPVSRVQPLARSDTEPVTSNFSTPPATGFLQAPVAQQPTSMTPVPAKPAHSAFSNLTAKPNPFGGMPSVFGGVTFGVPSSSASGMSSASLFPPAPQQALEGPKQPSTFGSVPSVTPSLSQPSSSMPSPLAPSVGTSASFVENRQPLFGSIDDASKYSTPASNPFTQGTRASFQMPGLNPNAPNFTPSSIFASTTAPPLTPSAPAISSDIPSLSVNTPNHASPSPATVPSSSLLPSQSKLLSTPTRIVERSETLWDFPGLPSQDQDIMAKGFVTPNTSVSVSPSNPPQLGKVQPMALPPTPTARWFDPTSQPKKASSLLSLRKQSLLSLQMPDAPSPAEILSPLALPSPRVLKSPPGHHESPTPKTRLPPEPVASSSGVASSPSVASSSRVTIQDTFPVVAPLTSKGKEKETLIEPDVLVANFLRRSPIVKKLFKTWKKKTMDRAAYAEACRRTDAYKEKIQHERLSNSLGASPKRIQESPKQKRTQSNNSPEASHRTRIRPRVSNEYRTPLTDEELAQRLKENHAEHERRWTRGSFLKTIKARVLTDAPDNVYPSQWRVWLSTNSENDGTAIWLEHKFDVPESGEWMSDKVFSIPVVPKSRKPPSPGSPGLIVFERTPLEGFDDVIEKKYRILDDCARLRDVVEAVRSQAKLRFTPALLTITWTDGDTSDVAPDFGDMVKNLKTENVIGAVDNLIISSTATDLDRKFEEVMARLRLDYEDKSTLTLSWKGLLESFITPFKNYASDWLDSCWVNEQETLDWSRYGEVVRSVEEAQTALVKEVLGLLKVPYNAHVEMSVEFQDHAHLGETYATGVFLNAIIETAVRHAEEALGHHPSPAYVLPKDRVEASRRRFDDVLQTVAERLRVLAVTSLSSRTGQKRRASEEDSGSGSPSSAKRRKASPSLMDLSFEEAQTNGFLTPPPPSKTTSSTAIGETPYVTAAMLRALAQGILQSK